MKKILIALGLLVAFIITGCSQESEEAENSNSQADEASETEETTDDNQAVKVALLDAQMNLTSEVATYQQRINTYTAATADEAATEADISAAKEDAKAAAEEASGVLEGYEIEVDLPEEEKTNYENAISTLKSYYDEISTALAADTADVDLSSADEAWAAFQSEIKEIYENADLMVPDMASALS